MDIHPCKGLLSLISLLLDSMDVDGGTLLIGSMTSWMDKGMDSPSSQNREPLSLHTKESIEEEMSDLEEERLLAIFL